MRDRTCDVLYLNEELSDVSFLFFEENKNSGKTKRRLIAKVPANKAILASGSPVFHAEFFGPIKEQGDVEIVDSSPKAFKEFLQCFYLGRVTFSMENIVDVMYLADKYDCDDCMKACVRFLMEHATTKDICSAFELAILHEHPDLKEFCKKHISLNTLSVLKSDGFLSCSQKALCEILKSDLRCQESIVFDRCLAWAKNACQQIGLDENVMLNVRNQLGECVYLIRFDTMTIQEFSQFTRKCEGFFTLDELDDIASSMSTTGFISTKFNQNRRLYWNQNRIWKCKPNLTKNDNNIEKRETVFFTSNKSTLLGGIGLRYMEGFIGGNFRQNPTNRLTITEIKGHSVVSQAGTILIDKGLYLSANDMNPYIELPTRIAISPHNIYQICLEFADIDKKHSNYTSNFGEVKSGNGLCITFEGDIDQERSGHLIACLNLID